MHVFMSVKLGLHLKDKIILLLTLWRLAGVKFVCLLVGLLLMIPTAGWCISGDRSAETIIFHAATLK